MLPILRGVSLNPIVARFPSHMLPSEDNGMHLCNQSQCRWGLMISFEDFALSPSWLSSPSINPDVIFHSGNAKWGRPLWERFRECT